MENQDQRRTHSQGHEGHVCHKCGWLFPNPHPSAKQRRAHRKVCGTIEGCKVLVSERQTRSCASDDDDEHEQLFDDDSNNNLDENDKQSGGTRESLIRSGDEVFLDAIANFSDGALSPGIRSLRDSLESATDVEILATKFPETAAGASESGRNVVRDCSLTSVAKEINLKVKDELKSDRDMIEILVSSNNSVGDICEGVPELVVSDMVNSHCQVVGGAINLKDPEFLSLIPRDELLLEENSTGVRVKAADMIQFATSSDVKMLQEESGEGDINMFTFTHPWCDDGYYVADPKNEYEDVKHHEIMGLGLQKSPSLHSSEVLKQKQGDLKDSVSGETSFFIDEHQLSERRELFQDVHVLDSSIKKQKNSDFVDEARHAEESIEVSSVKFIVESDNKLVDTGASKHAIKSERCMIPFSEEQKSEDDNKNKKLQNISSTKESLSSDRTIKTRKGVDCTYRGPVSVTQEDIKDDEINIERQGNEKFNRFVGSSADSHQAQDEESKLKAAQCVSYVEDVHDAKAGWEVFGSNAVPVQDQSENKIASSAIYTSDDPRKRFDSFRLKANSRSSSVSGLSSTDLLVSKEAGKFNLKGSASGRQQCEKPELLEPPSFMAWVEPGNVVGPKAAAPEFHKASQAGWFPTITHVTKESQGRKKNEEKIAEITKWSPSKQPRPLKTLLSEAANNKKPKSPKLEEISVHHKSRCEPPATQAGKVEDGKEWNSPTKYPAHSKRKNKKKGKGRSQWIQCVCCSSADPQRS